jgi:hypothetical protein
MVAAASRPARLLLAPVDKDQARLTTTPDASATALKGVNSQPAKGVSFSPAPTPTTWSVTRAHRRVDRAEVLARGANTRGCSYTGATAGSTPAESLYNAESSAVAAMGLKPRTDWIFQPRSQKGARAAHPLESREPHSRAVPGRWS